MPTRPTGTVTFLFTDIEGSTRKWEEHPQAMQSAFARQEAITRKAIQANGGYAYKMIGDAFQAAFPTAAQALHAALDAQLALHAEQWPLEAGDVRVRMSLHTGVTEERGDDYVGPALNRVARLLSEGYGGQVLISLATQQLLRDNLPAGVTLRDMGEHRLKDLAQPEHIFQMVSPQLQSEFPPLKTLDSRPNNLPVQTTPLVGRELEIAAVRERLLQAETRLLTLTGPGGIGKTRLALQVGAEVLDSFPGGVFFVNLAPLLEPDLVLPTTAYTLGLREASGQSIADTLKEYVQGKTMLLVLDNFEHVVEAGAEVAELLKSSPNLKTLVTSRASLHLSMEREYVVPPLQVPDPKHLSMLSLKALSRYEGVELFRQRAEAAKPGFEVNEANAMTVAEICYRLEGIPLAIELAAARSKALPPKAILERLTSRLKLLTGGARDLPARQQTLRAAIDWSYDLLNMDEKSLLRRLSVFRGGRTLEAAEAVCNLEASSELDVLGGVTSLVDKSLMYEVEGSASEARYWMLETIQEYAWEKLRESGEAEALQRQHALYFMELAEQAEPELTAANQAEWLARLEDEHDNFRIALRWASEPEEKNSTGIEGTEIGLRIASTIWRFWYVRGYFSEGREQLATYLERASTQTSQENQHHPQPDLRSYRAKALNGAGTLTYLQSEYAAARSLFEASLTLRRELGDKEGIAFSLSNLGTVTQDQGDYAAARLLHEESLALRRELGDKRGIAFSLNNLGNVLAQQEENAAARALLEESLLLFREIGDKRSIGVSLNNLGNLTKMQGDYVAARALYEESLLLARELGDKHSLSFSLNNLGNLTQMQGDYAAARALYEESLALRRELGDKQGVAASLAGLGEVGVGGAAHSKGPGSIGSTERGVRLLGAVEALLEGMGAVLDAEDRGPYERSVQQARTQLSEEAFERAMREGHALSMEEAIKYALERSSNV